MAEPTTVLLAPGELWFGAGAVVQTLLGSCVAVALWHPARRVGGMCHYLLPSAQPDGGTDLGSADPGHLRPRYGDEAVALLLHHVRAVGTAPEEYRVAVAGGGRQFGDEGPAAGIDVAERNVAAVDHLLAGAGFTPSHRDVGGSGPRLLRLDLTEGRLSVGRSRLDLGVPA